MSMTGTINDGTVAEWVRHQTQNEQVVCLTHGKSFNIFVHLSPSSNLVPAYKKTMQTDGMMVMQLVLPVLTDIYTTKAQQQINKTNTNKTNNHFTALFPGPPG